ncbi:MAG: TonB-dependent receptor plug domain-containing protein [Longimicrobiales bacterium]|nr:TonB-dependent receptor plug domain-containing protein [Longimicrobiales bacterium]
MKIRSLGLVSVVLVTSTSCGIQPRPVTPNEGRASIITREQIEKTGARTMWEALSRSVRYVRFQESGLGQPERIRRRGESSIVLSDDMPIYIDQVQVRQIQVLASLPARNIETIRILNGVDATTYYGTNAGDGVILIETVEAERR